jgi:hypothetical protein
MRVIRILILLIALPFCGLGQEKVSPEYIKECQNTEYQVAGIY